MDSGQLLVSLLVADQNVQNILVSAGKFFPWVAAFLRKSGYNLADLEYSVVTD